MILQYIPLIVLIIIVLTFAVIGYIKGARKTTYYILVDIIVTIILVFALSFVTISSFFNSESLIEFLKEVFRFPNELQTYYLSKEVSDFIKLIANIIARLILFIGIFSITKFILKLTLFRKLYPVIIDEVLSISKKKKDRKIGFIIGSIKGLIISLVFVLPALLYELPKYQEQLNNILNLIVIFIT